MSLIHLGERANAGNPGNPGNPGISTLGASAFYGVLIYILYRVHQMLHPPPSKRDYAYATEVEKCTGVFPMSLDMKDPLKPEDWPCYQKMGFKEMPENVVWKIK